MAWEPTLQSSPLPVEVGGTNSQTVISAPTASSWSGWDANSNMSAKNFLSGLSIIPTSSGTTTLTVSSNETQVFTGTLTQICVMPAVSTLVLGQSYRLINKSSGVVTVNSSGGDLIQTMESNTTVLITCTSLTGTDASSWTWVYNPAAPFDFPLSVSLGGTGYSSVNSSPSPSSWAGWDANKNLSANNTINGYATTATAAGTTTLTVASAYQQYFTGSTTQTVVMPVTSTLVVNQSWQIINNSSGNVTVNASDGSLILTLTPNTYANISCSSLSITTNAAWNIQYELNQLSPSLSNGGVTFTNPGGSTDYGNIIYSLNYLSYFLFNNFYNNLLGMSFSSSGLSPATVNFGNVQALIIGFSPNWALVTSISFPSLIVSVAGGITLNTPSLTSFTAPNLMYLSSSFTLTNTSLTSLSLPAYTGTGNSLIFTASPVLSTISVPALKICFGISGTLPALTSFDLTSLQVMGTYTLTANALTTLSLPALLTIGNSALAFTANFTPVGTSLATISMPLLTQINGTFSPNLAALTTLTVTNLATITGAFALVAASLTTLALPALTTLNGGFSVTCAAATTVTLTLLSTVTGAVASSFASLTTLSLPALTSVSTTFTLTAANLVTFSMNSGLLNIGGNFTMTGMKLDQTSVDGILVSLAALDGTGGTTSYNNRVVNLSGGTSSAPSATGLTAKATLQARGCTVTTN